MTDFNITDYDYMDNMPLAGWAWELIRRNSGYKNTYKDIKRLSKKATLKYSDIRKAPSYDVGIIYSEESLFDLLKSLEIDFHVRPILTSEEESDQENYLWMQIDSFNRGVTVPKPTARYDDFKKNKPLIIGATAVKYHLLDKESIQQIEKKDSPHPLWIVRGLAPVDMQHTLYLGISLGANIDDIDKEIKDILWNVIKVKKKKRFDKWKYYILVFDLYKVYHDYNKVTETLSSAFPDKEHGKLQSIRNIRNYQKEALALINGDYKKYLYLTK